MCPIASYVPYSSLIPLPKQLKKSMITHPCIFEQIFTKYNMPEITKGFCMVDNLVYNNLSNTKFYYTERIGENRKMCNSFERIKQIAKKSNQLLIPC